MNEINFLVILGIVDTDCNPNLITFPIPGKTRIAYTVKSTALNNTTFVIVSNKVKGCFKK